jgi:sialate O-acetylesterase
MEWPVKKAKDANSEIAAANYSKIRLFTVQKATSANPVDDCNGRWVECDSNTVADFSAVGYFFGRELYKNLNVPVGLIFSSWGGTSAQVWTRKEILVNDSNLIKYWQHDQQILSDKQKYQDKYAQTVKAWKAKVVEAKSNGQKPPVKPRTPGELGDKNRSSMLYNAMIHPLIPYAIKGVIWYQGEANAGDALSYRTLFPAMIKNWRTDWQQGDFSFYYVQLACFDKTLKLDNITKQPIIGAPADSSWAMVREAQLMTLSLPNTGMAVAMDIGEVNNIHPKNKQEVGKRLALWALAKDYGFKNIVYSGPMYKEMKIENGKVKIYFDYVGTGLMAKGDTLKGFAICGEDKKFVWANAKIEGNNVLVWSEKIKNPTAIRYGWANWIDCNLYNKENLPASPFRTDHY